MKKQGTSSRNRALLLVVVGLLVATLALSPLISCSSRNYMKMNPPPDVDKATFGHEGELSCWLAAAANMLAGAGYGTGDNVQTRAEGIYMQMYNIVKSVNNGYIPTGWPKSAIIEWLQWLGPKSNPYKIAKYYGCEDSDIDPYPWGEENGPQIIGNELRRCQMVSLMIHDPASAWCHVITAWGDDGGYYAQLNTNPTKIVVTDSDEDTGGDVQTYTYDQYDDGWSISYLSPSDPYIMGITTLCPVTNEQNVALAQGACMVYSIRQTGDHDATDLHYKVGAKSRILSYRILIGWDTDKPPEIVESFENGTFWLTVDWDLSENPVPSSTEVYIITDFVLPYSSSPQNPILYKDVHFTYTNPGPGPDLPALSCALFTPEISITDWTDICGGYVVCGFDIFDPTGQNPTGECRFLQEYYHFQDPELHQFSLSATPTMNITQVAAGGFHTVGLRGNGTVLAVGNNGNGQCNVTGWTNVTKVEAGEYHTVGLKSDGTVLAVGNNGNGQCNVTGWANITKVAAGGYHTVGLENDRTAVAVGLNIDGQCNVGSWANITQVAAGGFHTVGVKDDGTAVAVGFNNQGQCGVSGWTDIVQVAAGARHTVGLKSAGSVVAVGENDDGQCNVGNWTDITQIAANGWHTVGLKSDGTVVAVGRNEEGQCNVTGWTDITQVAAGAYHTVGLKSDGTVMAVGNNDWGQCNISWQYECAVGNLRFGHSYGYLDADDLREFDNWMTTYPEIVPLDPSHPIEVELDWEGLLPYPPGAGSMEP